MANYPEITYRFPTLVNGDQSSLQPTIVIDWSADMETTQFSDPAARAKNIVLIDVESGLVLGTDFVDYTATQRRVQLKPSVDLVRSKLYRIVVKDKLVSTDGRKSFNQYDWTFQTASGSILEPVLLSPGDAVVQPVFPTLIWSTVAATGIVNYTVQIDDRWDFGSPTYSTTVTTSAVTPAGMFTDDTTYYWRVMAYTSGATGAWSDVRSFYYGRQQGADPTSRQTLPDSDLFGVKSLSFKNGLSHQKNHPTIAITFTSEPASGFESYIEVISKNALPRNDDPTSYDDNDVTGTWTQNGNTITLVPDNPISTNTRYEIKVSRDMPNTFGYILDEDYIFYWTGKYTPYYVSSRVIRSRFLGAEQQVPDDLINFYIYMASLEANARYYAYFYDVALDTLGDNLGEDIVRDQAVLKSHGVLKWVEAATAYKLLKAILFENLRDIGRTERLGDALVSLTADFVKGIEAALEEVKEELEEWEDFLTPSDYPLAVSKGINWWSENWDYDYDIGRGINRRDDGFCGGWWGNS